MQRRDFLTLLGRAVAAWPIAARAQQPVRVRRIGVLMASAGWSQTAVPGLVDLLTPSDVATRGAEQLGKAKAIKPESASKTQRTSNAARSASG